MNPESIRGPGDRKGSDRRRQGPNRRSRERKVWRVRILETKTKDDTRRNLSKTITVNTVYNF